MYDYTKGLKKFANRNLANFYYQFGFASFETLAMITESMFIDIALSFPNTEQVKHFERIGFKVKGKRMFASYLAENNTANIFLTPEQQKFFCKKRRREYLPSTEQMG